jgi:hypothetical protein
MTGIDPYAATRNLIENAFSYLTWHEDACKTAGFKGISQIWKEEPAWYFWLASVQGGFLLRLKDDEPLNDSQYISLTVHFYPSPSEAEECQLSLEESRLLADSSVFDMPTCTPRFEQYEACLPYFITAEISLLIGSDNQLQMLVHSTENEMQHPAAKFLDLLVNTLNFKDKTHHQQALQLEDDQGVSLFLIYNPAAFQDFLEYFEIDESTLVEPRMNESFCRWREFIQMRVDCSIQGTCGCH